MAINPDIDQESAVETIAGWWQDWTTQRRQKEARWAECVMNYLVEIDEGKYQSFPWRSKVADTLSQETADASSSNLLNGLFPLDEKFFELTGDDLTGQQYQGAYQQYVEQQLAFSKFIESVRPFVKQLAVIGNAPYLGHYRAVKPARRFRQRVIQTGTGRGKVEVRDTDASAYETCVFETLDAFDVVYNPLVLCLDETPIIRRMVLPLAAVARIPDIPKEALVELEKHGEKKKGPSEQSDSLKMQRERAFGLQRDVDRKKDEEEERDEIELLWAYGDLEIDGEIHRDHLALVGNRSVLLRFERQPFWAGRPIGWGGYDRLWNTALEKGPLEPLVGIQQLVNTFQNQKADILNLIINGCFAFVDDGIIDPDNLWLRPGGFVEVGDINNLKPLQPSQNVALTYTEIEQLRSRAERSSGVSRFDMGQAPGGRRTAFEANLIRGGGSSRYNDVLRHIANGPMEDFVNWTIGTLQQFKWRPGPGQNLLSGLPNEALLGRYRANFLGADYTVLSQFMMQNIMLFFQIAAQSPELAAGVKMNRLAWKVLKLLKLDEPGLINTEAETQQQLALMNAPAQRAPRGQAGASGPGEPGGQDESLEGLVARVAA